MTPRALRAIAGARLRAERRALGFACVVSALFGYLNALDPAISLPMSYCGILGIAWALAQSHGRHTYLDASERSAPLFGRELGRAKAIAPVVCTAFTTVIYWSAQYLRGATLPASDLLPVLAAAITATLVALNATLKSGATRLGICAAAGASVAICCAIVALRNGDPLGVAVEVLFCVVAGFFALRQYGESLARYDPL